MHKLTKRILTRHYVKLRHITRLVILFDNDVTAVMSDLTIMILSCDDEIIHIVKMALC